MLQRRKKNLYFKSERDLEDFVWVHLNELLTIQGLKRQYMIKQDVCDILAVDETGRLTVIELKNTVDRYIVQQLTRYYDRLITEKPLSTEINYNLPIRLIAIAPTYHEHNLIDRKYSNLEIELLTYEILELENESIYFTLSDLKKVRCAEVLFSLPKDQKTGSSDRAQKKLKQEKINQILHHYVRVRCAHKLGLPDVSPSELAASNARFSTKGSKVFRIRLNEYTPSGSPKFVSVRVPSTIGLIDFHKWVTKNVPMATGVKLSGQTHGVYPVEKEPDEINNEAVDVSSLDVEDSNIQADYLQSLKWRSL